MRPPGEKVHLKLIHFSPVFGQILQIYLILDLFLPFFKFPSPFFLGGGKKFKSRNRGVGKTSKNLNFIYQWLADFLLFVWKNVYRLGNGRIKLGY